MQQCHYNRSKGSARLRRSTSLSRSKVRTTSGENGLECFAVGLDDFLGGALAKIYDHVEGQRNDSATILDLALTTLRFDAGLIRNITTALYHVLIMLTRGRAQRLVLKAAEREGLEAYRLLFRRYEPISTVTTVSFGGDLMDSLSDFDKHDAHLGSMTRKKHCQFWSKSELSSKVMRKTVFEIMLLINTAGTTEWKNVKEIENVELARRSTQLNPMDLSPMDSQDQRAKARDCRKQTEYLQNNQTSGWSGTDDKSKGKPGTGKGKGKHYKGKSKDKPEKGKGKSKNKEKGKQHGKKGKNGFHKMEGHEDTQETQTGQEYTEWTDTSWTTLTAGLMQTVGGATGVQICGHGSKRQDSCHRRSRLKNSPIQRTEAAFQCLRGLTMCELSVNDERQQSEQGDGDNNWRSDRDDGLSQN